jgi:hypothetical protein
MIVEFVLLVLHRITIQETFLVDVNGVYPEILSLEFDFFLIACRYMALRYTLQGHSAQEHAQEQ